jgi:hypothetical protein
MDIYGFIAKPRTGELINIVLWKGKVIDFNNRRSCWTYILCYNNYYNIYLDEESRDCSLHCDIKEIIKSLGEEANIYEYPIEERLKTHRYPGFTE